MISATTLKLLKLEHSPRNIIHIRYLGKDFVFRTLSKKEYMDIAQIVSNDQEFEDLVCQTAIIYPKQDQYLFNQSGIAGLPEFCSKHILEHSHTTNIDKIVSILEEERLKNTTLDRQAFFVIKIAFPEVTREMYNDMDWNTIAEYVAMAEAIIDKKALIEAQKRIDPTAEFKLTIEQPQAEEEIKSEEEQLEENKKFIMSLYEQGIDPCDFYRMPLVKKENTLVKTPFLGGRHWNNEVVISQLLTT